MQAINNRLKKQGPERSHNIPKQYEEASLDPALEWVLKSTTPVILIRELDAEKLTLEITHSTLSGTS